VALSGRDDEPANGLIKPLCATLSTEQCETQLRWERGIFSTVNPGRT